VLFRSNSVDAGLWFLNAVLQYLKYTGDFEFVKKQLWNVMKSIVDSHVTGTIFGIHVDKDGLLCHGPQLTWMDATVDGVPVTPRVGKAVEIQALWYNGLRIIELVARKLEESSEADKYSQAAEKARASFAKFWNAERGCLFDVVDNSKIDSSMRPNQIFAAALDFCMIDREMAEKVVDIVQRDLLTPCGLRTLAKSDSKYAGVYAGDRRNRDRAYHNGTVWPWLLGPFVKAFLKTKGYSDFRLDFALKNFLLPLFTRSVSGVGLGTVNEIFDGDAPYASRGCVAQAWSVAEPLRAYVEDVRQIKPKFEKEVLTV
jgi:predicted glycogen debranching enzyme